MTKENGVKVLTDMVADFVAHIGKKLPDDVVEKLEELGSQESAALPKVPVSYTHLAMIIYYKQISEGYEDQKRFEIMQKVGLSRREVRSSVRRQIRCV